MPPPNINDNNKNKQDKYSFAYSKFVVDADTDILQIIAYALYKRDKVKWMGHQCSINQEPTKPQAVKWSNENSKPEKVEEYKESARKILNRFVQGVETKIRPGLRDELIPELREELPGINAEKVAAIDTTLRKLISQTDANQSFKANVTAGLAASVAYTVILIVIWFFLKITGFSFPIPIPSPPRDEFRPREARTPDSKVLEPLPQKLTSPR